MADKVVKVEVVTQTLVVLQIEVVALEVVTITHKLL